MSCGDYDTDEFNANEMCCMCQVEVEPYTGACDESGQVDSYGDGCEWYDNYPDGCGWYDTLWFQAFDMCCACADVENWQEWEDEDWYDYWEDEDWYDDWEDEDWYDDWEDEDWYDDYGYEEDYQGATECELQNEILMGLFFALPDTNNDGTVSYDELTQAVYFIGTGGLEIFLSDLFEQFDENEDMTISFDEWMNAVDSVHESGEIVSGTPLAQSVTEAELAAFDAITEAIVMNGEPIHYQDLVDGVNSLA